MYLEYSLIFLLKKKKSNVSVTCEIDPREKLTREWKHLAQQLFCQTDLMCND